MTETQIESAYHTGLQRVLDWAERFRAAQKWYVREEWALWFSSLGGFRRTIKPLKSILGLNAPSLFQYGNIGANMEDSLDRELSGRHCNLIKFMPYKEGEIG